MGSVVGPLWILEDGYSMQFDGTDDYIPILDITQTISWASNLSYSCWIKTSQVGVYADYHTAFGGRSNGGGVYDLGKMGTPYGTTDLVVAGRLGTTLLNNGAWHHLVTTFNYTTKEVIWYVDGLVDYSTTYPAWITHFNVSIGNNGFGGYYFEGNVDECALWKSILTPTEITVIYSNGNPINLTNFNPITWYRMGDNAVFKDPQWLLPENSNKDKNTNYSLEFDGSDDGINCGNHSSLQMTADVTVSAWIKTSLTTTQQQIIQRGADWVMNGFSLFVRSNDQVAIMLSNSGYPYATSSVTVTDGNWHHVVGVRDSSGGAGSLKIYVDGLDEGSVDGGTDAMANGEEVWIGSGTNGGSPFEGLIDDVSIFNSALSAGEVTAIWNNGVPSDLSGESNLVGYWKMGENATYKYPQWLLPNNENKDKESNYSLLFDGGDDTVNCGDLSAYDTGDLSFSVWIYKTTTARSYIINNSAPNAGNERGFLVIVDPWGGLQVDRRTPTHDATTGFNYPAAFTLNNWHHIVGVYEDTTYTIKLYLDGVLIDTDTGYASTNGFVSGDLYIGSGGGSVNWMVGKIDEVAVWDKELLAEEVTAIYNSGVPTDLSGESGLVDYWKMGDLTYSAGTADIWVVPDSSINNNTGFADNMTLDTRVGDAPNSINNALSLNMEIFDRVGDAPNSTNNALSYNMELSGRTTDVPT